jgi:hypothetical protein
MALDDVRVAWSTKSILNLMISVVEALSVG